MRRTLCAEDECAEEDARVADRHEGPEADHKRGELRGNKILLRT